MSSSAVWMPSAAADYQPVDEGKYAQSECARAKQTLLLRRRLAFRAH